MEDDFSRTTASVSQEQGMVQSTIARLIRLARLWYGCCNRVASQLCCFRLKHNTVIPRDLMKTTSVGTHSRFLSRRLQCHRRHSMLFRSVHCVFLPLLSSVPQIDVPRPSKDVSSYSSRLHCSLCVLFSHGPHLVSVVVLHLCA